MRRYLGLLAWLVVLAVGCAGNGSPGATAKSSTPPPAVATAYVLTVDAVDCVTSGSVGAFNGPLAVVVMNTQGQPQDGVNVVFQPAVLNEGPYGLGNSVSGDGIWGISGPGTGISAVGYVPARVGSVTVTAQVWPQGATSAPATAMSNTVVLHVTGY